MTAQSQLEAYLGEFRQRLKALIHLRQLRFEIRRHRPAPDCTRGSASNLMLRT